MQWDVVDLDVLARGQMRDAVLRIVRRDVADGAQLRGIQAAAGNLDAQHVDPLLALAVHALLQADRGEAVGIDVARVETGDCLLEAVDFFQIGQVAVVQAHDYFLSSKFICKSGFNPTYRAEARPTLSFKFNSKPDACR